ncbi:MAG TPA: aldo/keto reductase [Chthoniobacteraceae bacterium]|nr:aldo/keto reductase [Chthoniobacteraceae bacterium]
MEKRRLGRSALAVAPIAFGGNVFGWTVDEAVSFRLLDRFVERGFNLIDTANIYGGRGEGEGASEAIFGKWLAASGKRDAVVVATKVGMEMAPGRKGLSAAAIKQEVEASLRRLQIDTIDLYQSHEDDLATPQEETLRAYAELVQEGKVRVIGASNFSASRLAEALSISVGNGWPRYETLQPEYHLARRAEFEKELQPLCVEEEIGVITYFSLASGFLTGKYRSEADLKGNARGEIVGKYLDTRGLRLLSVMDEVAARHEATLAQVALAWLLTRDAVVAPIVSATSLAQLDATLDAVDLRLDDEALARLEEASDGE